MRLTRKARAVAIPPHMTWASDVVLVGGKNVVNFGYCLRVVDLPHRYQRACSIILQFNA